MHFVILGGIIVVCITIIILRLIDKAKVEEE